MKLYYSPAACSLVVRIILNELNLPCEFVAVDLKTKKTAAGDSFLSISAKGQVPALMLDNKEVLTENIAIQQYLAETYKADSLFPPQGHFKRYRVLEWMTYISMEIHKSFGPFFNPNVPLELREQVYMPILKRKFQYIEDRLTQDYLMGDTFTLPDAYLFVMLTWLPAVKINLSEWPHLNAFFERLKERESVKNAIKEDEGFLVKK